MITNNLKKIIFSALFLAMGFILPLFIGQIPTIGQMLLPMHIPVFLCGFICDWKYGALIGFILPLLRSLLFSVPIMYPTAIAVAFEMAVYGLITGLIFGVCKKKNVISVYASMLPAMILGRMVRCFAEIVLLNLKGNPFIWKTFASMVILHSLPGIILQLILIPTVILTIKNAKIINNKK
ncbi:MAG: ECF transporter S component [Clostridia bacterium]|nr:ECF transporter S component [Clostridia bacterium]